MCLWTTIVQFLDSSKTLPNFWIFKIILCINLSLLIICFHFFYSLETSPQFPEYQIIRIIKWLFANFVDLIDWVVGRRMLISILYLPLMFTLSDFLLFLTVHYILMFDFDYYYRILQYLIFLMIRLINSIQHNPIWKMIGLNKSLKYINHTHSRFADCLVKYSQ